MKRKTVTFECPNSLFEELEAYQDRHPEHENRSQAIRYAIRNIVDQGGIELPQDMAQEIDRIVENSNVFESRSHYLRVCHREYQDGSGLKQL